MIPETVISRLSTDSLTSLSGTWSIAPLKRMWRPSRWRTELTYSPFIEPRASYAPLWNSGRRSLGARRRLAAKLESNRVRCS